MFKRKSGCTITVYWHVGLRIIIEPCDRSIEACNRLARVASSHRPNRDKHVSVLWMQRSAASVGRALSRIFQLAVSVLPSG